MLRRLLNIASIVCLVLCVALMGLWVRSHRLQMGLHGHLDDRTVFTVRLEPGAITFRDFPAWSGDRWPTWGIEGRYFIGDVPVINFDDGREKTFGFVLSRTAVERSGKGTFSKSAPANMLIISIPLWSLVVLAAALAIALKAKPRWRFTVLELLGVTTSVAIGLGMIVWLDRAWIGK
jgi:hypothetical protein